MQQAIFLSTIIPQGLIFCEKTGESSDRFQVTYSRTI